MNTAAFWDVLVSPFVGRAAIVGIAVALCAALLGVVLVLKNYALIGHGLSEVSFASMSLALALGLPPLSVSLPVLIVASFLIMAVSQKKGVSGDTAIGIAATASLALGIIVTAMTSGFNIDVYNYMFGSILSIGTADVWLSIGLAVVVLVLYLLFHNRFFLIICDEDYAKTLGVNVTGVQFLISFLTALTVVIGMRIMGTLLISSLVILPAVTARQLARSYKALVITSAIVSVVCVLLGIVVSVALDWPTGASIVATNVTALIVAAVVGKVRR